MLATVITARVNPRTLPPAIAVRITVPPKSVHDPTIVIVTNFSSPIYLVARMLSRLDRS